MARSMVGGDLVAQPQLEQAPLMHWIADRRSEKVRQQCNQNKVDEYGWSHFTAKRTGGGGEEECSTALTLCS